MRPRTALSGKWPISQSVPGMQVSEPQRLSRIYPLVTFNHDMGAIDEQR